MILQCFVILESKYVCDRYDSVINYQGTDFKPCWWKQVWVPLCSVFRPQNLHRSLELWINLLAGS